MASSTLSSRAPVHSRVSFPSRAPARSRSLALTVRAAGPGKGGEEGGVAWDKSVGLDKELTGTGPFTLFAPDDDAFGDACRALGTTKMELVDLESLPEIVKNHVTSKDLSEGFEAQTLGGGKLTFSLAGGAKVNGVKIKKADVTATNGVIHVVNAVLTP
eukprot:scaffold14.g1279.t1